MDNGIKLEETPNVDLDENKDLIKELEEETEKTTETPAVEEIKSEYEEMNYNDLKQIAKDNNIPFENNIKKTDLIELLKENVKPVDVEDEEEIDEENQDNVDNEEENDDVTETIDKIDLDNKPISPIIDVEDEEIPRHFTPIKPTPKPTPKQKILLHNGRVYKELSNGRGMFADTGETFNLSDLK